MSENIALPKTAGPWSRPDRGKRIDERDIFSYMDGGGELYLGYRFDHLDAYEYAAPGRDPILVELYWMRGSDDAFGLLSNDWGGDPVALQPGDEEAYGGPVPASRALYGAGLLRIWSDTLYARVLAGRETPESREQVLALGRAIVAGRPAAPRPALLRLLPLRAAGYEIRRDRVWFLRSHLVLNSAYYLASDNILDLSPSCEAAIAPYETAAKATAQRNTSRRRPQVLVVQYPGANAARAALAHFLRAYTPEALGVQAAVGGQQAAGAPRQAEDEGRKPEPASRPTPSAVRDSGAWRIEQGWIAWRLDGSLLVLAFDAPDERTGNALVTR